MNKNIFISFYEYTSRPDFYIGIVHLFESTFYFKIKTSNFI